ncbi:hypothetical protein HPB49_009857 [Dermacentor silvarum]|uniref:Uncharacterized protein n=1 Tax=Dermacentor silvarum TaxID=543639 RepID=A0ACB8CE72_DERSI|nr:hypothetical protein HPB49_009857 [Dermacentor silvarum]
MFLLNVYCQLKSPQSAIKQLLEQATHAARNHPLLIMGEFNAALTLGGYTYANTRGNLLHKVIEIMDLTIVNDPRNIFRLGTGITRVTNADLTLTRNIPQACWTNQEEKLGSEHAPTTPHGLEHRVRIGTARLLDRTMLQEIREQGATHEQSKQL